MSIPTTPAGRIELLRDLGPMHIDANGEERGCGLLTADEVRELSSRPWDTEPTDPATLTERTS